MKLLLGILGFVFLVAVIAYLGRNYLNRSTVRDLQIRDCQLNTSQPLEFPKNRTLVLRITSAQPGEFHLHGYDLKRDLTAGRKELITFKTVESGRFEIELETRCHLGELVVLNDDGSIPAKLEPPTSHSHND